MENASKALIMAGGVLIGILVLTLAVYLFATFGAQSFQMHKRIADNQLAQFNEQFTRHLGRQDITIHEIITLLHLAKQNNNNYMQYNDSETFKDEYEIIISCSITGEGVVNQDINESKESLILNKLGASDAVDSDGKNKHLFECTGTEYHKNGRIGKMTFKEI